MSHFAQLDENGVVMQVIRITQDVIDTGAFGEPLSFVQTSYNTNGGIHSEGGTPLRKNFASVGYTYDSVRDAFIPPKPYPSWTLNEQTCLWDAPTTMPADGKLYEWAEGALSWMEVVPAPPPVDAP